MLRCAALASLALFVASAPVRAQTAPDDEPIIIQGTANTQKQIDDFVKQLTANNSGDQLGRFVAPFCPRVIGLPPEDNELVTGRMRKVAAAVGAPVAPEKCTIDAYVIVGGDKREIIEGIRKQFGSLVDGVPGSVLKRVEAAPGPVAAWQIVGRIGSDGMPLTTVSTSSDTTPIAMSNTVGWASRIADVTRPQFLGSILVVEGKALNGVDTRQLADYAAMRLLAPTDTTHRTAVAAPSIIKLFDPGTTPDTAPASVTWWDFAFLKALYASSNDVNAWQQRGEMARKMKKELSKVPPQP